MCNFSSISTSQLWLLLNTKDPSTIRQRRTPNKKNPTITSKKKITPKYMQINPIDEHRAAVEVKFHCKKKTKKRRRSRENRKRLEARGSHIERERTAHFRHLQPSTDRLSPSCGQLALHLDETGGWLSATCDPEKKGKKRVALQSWGLFSFFFKQQRSTFVHSPCPRRPLPTMPPPSPHLFFI